MYIWSIDILPPQTGTLFHKLSKTLTLSIKKLIDIIQARCFIWSIDILHLKQVHYFINYLKP